MSVYEGHVNFVGLNKLTKQTLGVSHIITRYDTN